MVKVVMVLVAYMAVFVVVPQVTEMQVQAETRQTHALSLKRYYTAEAVVVRAVAVLDEERFALFGPATLEPSHLLV